jgi:hypothetical protein
VEQLAVWRFPSGAEHTLDLNSGAWLVLALSLFK